MESKTTWMDWVAGLVFWTVLTVVLLSSVITIDSYFNRAEGPNIGECNAGSIGRTINQR